MASYSELGFPNDDHYWMVTWVERVGLIGNDFRFKLRLVSIKVDDFLKNFYKAENYHNSFITCYIDTPLFAQQAEIGSVWHCKKLIFSPSRQYEIYSGLTTHTITLPQPSCATIQSLSEIAGRTENLASYHPFPAPRRGPLPSLLGQSPCLVVDAPYFQLDGREQTDFLLFPPSELLRFYYNGSSSYLFYQLLRNGLAEDRIYKRRATRYNSVTQELFVQLRKQVPDEDALLVGRLAGDSEAYRAARDIGRHIQQQLISSNSASLLTTFPFQSPTTLHVIGKSLKTIDKRWAFFVYAIVSCSSAFPFRHLLYSRDNNRMRTAVASLAPARPRKSRGSSLSNGEPTGAASYSASLTNDREVPTSPFTHRFTKAPRFTRLPKEQRPVLVSGKIPRWYSSPERASVSSPPPTSGPEDVGLADSLPSSLQEEAPTLAFNEFRDIAIGLTQFGLPCHCLMPQDRWARSKYFTDFYLPPYYGPDNKLRKWLTVVTGFIPDKHIAGKKWKLRKRRRAFVMEIVYGHATFYLLECEAGVNESFSRMLIWYDQAVNVPNELDTLFGILVDKKGVWRDFPFPLYATTRPLHHAAGETGLSVAKRVFTYIKQIINRYNSVPFDSDSLRRPEASNSDSTGSY